MGNRREKPQINRFCTAQKLIWVGAALLAPLVWSLAFSYRPAAVPIQRPVSHPHVAEDDEHIQVEVPGSEESAQQSGSEDPGPAQAELSPVANEHGEADGDADHEAAPEELPIVQEDVPIEQLSISRLPPRPDAHCSEDVDASLPEAEQQAAVFACRKAIAREQAEAACAAVGADEEAERFTRASLDIAALIRDEAGGPGVGVRPNADSAEVRAIPDSIPIAVEPEADVVSSQILANGHWEYHEIRTILTALQLVDQDHADARPPLLLDVGANLGTYSIVAAALGYDVIAFEAMERNVAAIHQTLCWTPELRERITLFPYALGADELSCFVVSDTGNVADGHVVCNEEEVAAMAGALSRATVHSVRLGDYLSSVKADVMKIDVEGYEPHVLAGAGTALDSVQFALTEVSAQDMPKAVGKSFEECGPEYLNSWVDRGFNVSICDAWSNCIGRDVTPIDEAVQATTNQRLANFLMQRHD